MLKDVLRESILNGTISEENRSALTKNLSMFPETQHLSPDQYLEDLKSYLMQNKDASVWEAMCKILHTQMFIAEGGKESELLDHWNEVKIEFVPTIEIMMNSHFRKQALLKAQELKDREKPNTTIH